MGALSKFLFVLAGLSLFSFLSGLFFWPTNRPDRNENNESPARTNKNFERAGQQGPGENIRKELISNEWKVIVQNVRGLITKNSRETLELIEEYPKLDKVILMNIMETWLHAKIKKKPTLRASKHSDVIDPVKNAGEE